MPFLLYDVRIGLSMTKNRYCMDGDGDLRRTQLTVDHDIKSKGIWQVSHSRLN